MPRYIGRDNLRKRLEPHQGALGRAIYTAGAVRIELPEETLTVRPAFGLQHEAWSETVELGPLCEALAEDRVVAALLVRLGGFAVGVFEGERLVASKVGTRFVKGRHKKGGSSANRFRRRRGRGRRRCPSRGAIASSSLRSAATGGPWTRCSRPSRVCAGSKSAHCRASSRRAIRVSASSSVCRTSSTP